MKTQATVASVDSFIASVDAKRQTDCRALVALFERVIGAKARMWGTSIVGFGDHTYRTANGRDNPFFFAGFSPRKQNLVLYILDGFSTYDGLLKKLGKHSTGKSCLYVNALADIDLAVLEELIRASLAHQRAS